MWQQGWQQRRDGNEFMERGFGARPAIVFNLQRLLSQPIRADNAHTYNHYVTHCGDRSQPADRLRHSCTSRGLNNLSSISSAVLITLHSYLRPRDSTLTRTH
jgi:hypothetical protein